MIDKHIYQNDYYPFGMMMVGRNFSASEYRFGFNGQEKDDEIKGSGNSLDFGDRMYDPRIGRWLSLDPMKIRYPCWSPYNYALNNPIENVDVKGQYSLSNHYKFTNNALTKLGYNDVAADLIAHYTAVYADHAPKWIRVQQGQYFRDGIDYSNTSNSQNTSSKENSTWHSMAADNEKISAADAKKRGQQFGWGKVIEAANEAKKVGGLGNLEKNSAGIQALGQGLHALQDAQAHQGVSMDDHSVYNDMYPSDADVAKVDLITTSAVIAAEALGGKYDNLKDGMILDLTGTTMEQFNQIKGAIQAGVNSRKDVKGVTLTGKPTE